MRSANALSLSACAGLLLSLAGSMAQEAPSIMDLGWTEGGKMTCKIPSDLDSYHILRRSIGFDRTHQWRAVAVVRGAEGEVSLADSVRAFGKGFYQIETYSNSSPGNADGDDYSDLKEVGRRGNYNALNPAPSIGTEHGSVILLNRARFEELSNRDDRPGATSVREVKFLVFDVHAGHSKKLA